MNADEEAAQWGVGFGGGAQEGNLEQGWRVARNRVDRGVVTISGGTEQGEAEWRRRDLTGCECHERKVMVGERKQRQRSDGTRIGGGCELREVCECESLRGKE